MPGKPTVVAQYKKALIRIPPDILERLQVEALKEERSVNGQIVYVLRTWCETKEREHCELVRRAVAEAIEETFDGKYATSPERP